MAGISRIIIIATKIQKNKSVLVFVLVYSKAKRVRVHRTESRTMRHVSTSSLNASLLKITLQSYKVYKMIIGINST
jgi:hypothetical protein